MCFEDEEKKKKNVGLIQAPKSKPRKASERADMMTLEFNLCAHYHASFILSTSRASAYCTQITILTRFDNKQTKESVEKKNRSTKSKHLLNKNTPLSEICL